MTSKLMCILEYILRNQSLGGWMGMERIWESNDVEKFQN